MTILVFGSTGMLGRALKRVSVRESLDVLGVAHSTCDIADLAQVLNWGKCLKSGDVIINAAGAIPLKNPSPQELIAANAAGPWNLADVARQVGGVSVVHVSTDCVFGGSENLRYVYGYRSETAPLDLYGRSKLAGEVPMDHVINVRTSFVGPEHGLWAHVAAQAAAGHSASGWPNTSWSGSHVDAVAEELLRIALVPHYYGARRSERAQQPLEYSTVELLATEWPISKWRVCQIIARFLGAPKPIMASNGPVIGRAMRPTIVLPQLDQAIGVTV